MTRFRNVFVLNSGRCGSLTFVRACEHMCNYTAAHETLLTRAGPARLDYPAFHIEADNRLSWLLGRLDERFGRDAFYVHLRRNPLTTARSFVRRAGFGILKAYREGILLGGPDGLTDDELALDYLRTIETNIALFLRDKPHRMRLNLESALTDFPGFWERIGADGDLEGALNEWLIRHNAADIDNHEDQNAGR
jgi:hypothetical protein